MPSRNLLIGIIGAVIVVIIVALAFLQPQAPQRETVLIVGTTFDPQTLDPALAYDIASAIVIQNIFDTLVTYKPGTTELQGKLAERWESNENATVWTFYLRKGVKFHDGTDLTADDVKYSIERAKELQGPPAFLIDVIDRVEVVDDYTVRFILKYPFAPFPSLMAFMLTAPVSPEAAEELGEAFAENPVGTGPFKLESWVKGQEVVLVANENYWRGKPQIDKIIIRIFKDPSSLRIALENGEVDMAFGIQPSDIPALLQNPDIKSQSIEGLVIEWLGMNLRKEPFNNPLFRKAVNYAINYEYILENILKGTATRLYGPLPPGIWGYDPNIETYAYKY
ncbi:MAG: ABC transporter substrate-binding protein, partial [Desulfurococcales archaeon]|nr:ABC transporter substrate-binding protein [Desulfurococcales archaeon]